MPYDKLYIKIACTICRGTHKVPSNRLDTYHFPAIPFKGCAYCDVEGMEMIEAADKAIAEFLKQLPESRLKRILENIDE